MKVLITDDDKNVRKSLNELILAFAPNITEIYQADSVNNGIKKINEIQPDVLFLDVELGDGTGMDLLEKITDYSFHVIFITAHNKYAVDAFKYSALDFLLKPINPEELINCFEKIKKNKKSNIQEQINLLKEMITTNALSNKKIALNTSDKTYICKIDDIIRCESDNSYTTFYIKNMPPVLTSKSLTETEELLKDFKFERIHKSHLININFIKTYVKTDGGYLIMENGDEVPVANRKKDYLIQLLKSL